MYLSDDLGNSLAETQISTPFVNGGFSDLSAGKYTVTVINDNGCVAQWSGRVKRCRQSVSGVIICRPYIGDPEPYPNDPLPDKDAIYFGDPITTSQNQSLSLDLDVYTNMSEVELQSIELLVDQQIATETQNILQNGFSAYEIVSQDELETDAKFVFKFDHTGSLLWLVHNLSLIHI